MRYVLTIGCLITLGGCCSTEALENRIASLQKENHKLQYETLAQQHKNECLIRHNDAKMSCNMFFQGEPNSVALHNKILRCMTNKGFANGADSCNNQ